VLSQINNCSLYDHQLIQSLEGYIFFSKVINHLTVVPLIIIIIIIIVIIIIIIIIIIIMYI